MDKSDNASERNFKVQLIIEAAQKRFGLYGIEKTAMREIADDLRLSKASLYYYFPDKESLYKAVVEKEQNEFFGRISEKTLNNSEPDVLLHEYVVTRLSYFRTLLNLSRLRLEAYSDIRPVFRESIEKFKEKEKTIIAEILKDGIGRGIFEINDTDRTASLFLDLLKGLRVSVISEKKMLIIDEAEYDILLEKTIAFTEIFINGLKTK